MHPQLDQVRDALGTHQVVVVLGARGLGKTQLLSELAELLERTSVVVVRLSVGSNYQEFAAPLRAVLDLGPDQELLDGVLPSAPVRILVDNAHELHRTGWARSMQDEWRSLLASDGARGRVSLVLSGRPRLREILGGEGSPLLNLGLPVRLNGMDARNIESRFGASQQMALMVQQKTGGHPVLAHRLIERLEGDVKNIGQATDRLIDESHDYIARLIEDHGLAARSVLGHLAQAGSSVDERVLLSTHFGSRYAHGLELVKDLTSTGLIVAELEPAPKHLGPQPMEIDLGANSRKYALGAEILRDHRILRVLTGPPVRMPVDDSGSHPQVAALLYRFENALREAISDSLSEVDSNWWATRVPDREASAVAELLLQEEVEAGLAPPKPHAIMYLTLAELEQIIIARDNWDEVFVHRFRLSREMFEGTVRAIGRIRNKVAHNRPVTPAECASAAELIERLAIGLRSMEHRRPVD